MAKCAFLFLYFIYLRNYICNYLPLFIIKPFIYSFCDFQKLAILSIEKKLFEVQGLSESSKWGKNSNKLLFQLLPCLNQKATSSSIEAY